MSCDEFAIRAEGVGKTFELYDRPIDRLKQLFLGRHRNYAKSFVALDGLSFAVRRGEVLGLVGRNGAGKSTLLQLICGTLQPTTGSLQVSGRIAALLELGAGFNPEFTGRENVFLNAAVLGLSRREIDARYDEIVAFSGIGDFIDQPVKTYSSGMYVRLAFAIATSIDPEILVVDEALSVGDGAFARRSFERIMNLKEKGATILFCSHSMYHIEAICDSAIWLDRGHMMMFDRPAKVVARYQTFLNGEEERDSHAIRDQGPGPQAAPVVSGVSGTARLLGVKGRRLAQASPVDDEGPLRIRAGQDGLLVEVAFRADAALPMPVLAYGIDREDGLSIASGSTAIDGVAIERREDARYLLKLAFPALPLMKGTFRLSVFLACERGLHVYDHAPNCVEFDVLHEVPAQGFVFLPHVWNDGRLQVVP